jgi:hypothetical protein
VSKGDSTAQAINTIRDKFSSVRHLWTMNCIRYCNAIYQRCINAVISKTVEPRRGKRVSEKMGTGRHRGKKNSD